LPTCARTRATDSRSFSFVLSSLRAFVIRLFTRVPGRESRVAFRFSHLRTPAPLHAPSPLSLCRTIALSLFLASPALAGPDVITSDISSASTLSHTNNSTAFSFAQTLCNLGDIPLQFAASPSAQHPIIAQNLYRYKVVNGSGRFEQIGMGWAFHEFAALQGNSCGGTCLPWGDASRLGSQCSSPDSASAMGQQQALRPRSEVNPLTGVFPASGTLPAITSALDRRLQVADADLDPAQNPGALYFAESAAIAPDDAASSNSLNNSSHRQVRVTFGATPTLTMLGTVRAQQPAITAWRDIDSQVTLANVDVPGEGRLILASRVTQTGPCTWHYEYAIENLNSDRAAGFFSVPLQSWQDASDIGFHDVDSHSGEPYDSADWIAARVGQELVWRSPQTFQQNPNSNALRWGTIYTFRFDSHRPPNSGAINIGLFKPGTPDHMEVAADVPGGCVADTDNGSATGMPDCGVGVEDLLYYLHLLAAGGVRADVDDGSGNGQPDGGVGIEDLLYYLERYTQGC
jgi:hypothetical protein